jgi:FemAB-related protein (PEP-CTERM system-associated)
MPAIDAQWQSASSAHDQVSALRVKPFEEGMSGDWDRFVQEQLRASFFHLTGWKRVIEKTFGHEPLYFYSERNGKITGIAPFFRVANWLVGRALISVPLGAYGGVCASDAESERALVEHAKQAAVSEQADYLELRHREGGLLEGFHPNRLYVTFQAPLLPAPEANRKRLPKDTRYMIRKGEKAGLRAAMGNEQMPEFYDLFAQSMRRLGTPVFPRQLFQNIVEEFPGQTQLLVVYDKAKPVAGVLSFFFATPFFPITRALPTKHRGWPRTIGHTGN